MKRSKAFGAALLSLSLMFSGVSMVPVYADGTKVVTLGADLSDAQKQTMLNYFKVNTSEVQIIYITNQDERNHLSGYIPLEQIGTRTVSCAYVKPTNSGGIKVRTANLNYVTGNMIASSLSTSGVKNCEVIAACPFEVSGTGALTGIQMAYETATGTTLDATKKDLATQEIIVTGNLSEEVGRTDAVALINGSKIDVIQNNITNHTDITNVVNNVATENNILLTQEQLEQVADFIQQIAEENYNYDDVADTLENIESNVTESEGGVGAGDESEAESGAENVEVEVEDEDSILNDIDESVLGEDVVTSSTDDPTLEEETFADDGAAEEEWETYSDDSENQDSYETPENIEYVDEYDGNTDGVEIEENIDSYETDDEPEVNETETLIAMLSEQSYSQYEKTLRFLKGEFGGDAEALRSTMGEDFTPSLVFDERMDEEKLVKLQEKIAQYYLEILAYGTGSYEWTGEEKYMSDELNMMNEWLQKLFGIDDKYLEFEEEDLLIDLYSEEKEALYNDVIKFFETLYGETSIEEEYEYVEESYDGAERYYEEDYSEDEYYGEEYYEEEYYDETNGEY